MSQVNDFAQLQSLAATGVVVGTTGAAVSARGCVVARVGLGDYTVTTDQNMGVAATALDIQAAKLGLGAGDVRFALMATNLLSVQTFDGAGAAADRDFSLSVKRIIP